MKTITQNERRNDMERFRFDDDYRKVYEFDEDANAYMHVGSYLAFGIDAGMDDNEKIKMVDEDQQ